MTTYSTYLSRAGAFLLLSFAAACGGSSSSGGSSGPGAVELGTAGDYVILSKSAITNTGTSEIVGNLGVSPGTSITGFALVPDPQTPATVSTTSALVTGTIYSSAYAEPTPTHLTAAIHDMELAFTTAAGRTADVTELGDGNIGGMTLAPKVYKWGTGLLIPTNVTLSGTSTDVWVFQIAQGLTVDSGVRVILGGEARAQNIFWHVGTAVTLGSTAHLEGILLAGTAINLGNQATVNGRLMAQTAVTLDANTVVEP